MSTTPEPKPEQSFSDLKADWLEEGKALREDFKEDWTKEKEEMKSEQTSNISD